MKKKQLIFSDLSKKQLDSLKEVYIQRKVDSMSIKELRKFVIDIIAHQITDTIDKEEEMEAWREMSDFFGEDFEIIISELQQKYSLDEDSDDKNLDPTKQRQDLLAMNNIAKEKTDMWDD